MGMVGTNPALAGAHGPQQYLDSEPEVLGQAGAAVTGVGTGRKPGLWEQGQGEKVYLATKSAPITYISSKLILSLGA